MESPIPDNVRHARPANDVSKTRARRVVYGPMANISAPWPRHHHRAAQARPSRLFQLGAPSRWTRPLLPQPDRCQTPGWTGSVKPSGVIPDPVVMEPVTGR